MQLSNQSSISASQAWRWRRSSVNGSRLLHAYVARTVMRERELEASAELMWNSLQIENSCLPHLHKLGIITPLQTLQPRSKCIVYNYTIYTRMCTVPEYSTNSSPSQLSLGGRLVSPSWKLVRALEMICTLRANRNAASKEVCCVGVVRRSLESWWH